MGNYLSKEKSNENLVVSMKNNNTGHIVTGIGMEKLQRSMGWHLYKIRCILTPVEDRFPAHACDLQIFKKSMVCKERRSGGSSDGNLKCVKQVI